MKSFTLSVFFLALSSGCAYSPSDTIPNESVQESDPYPLPKKASSSEDPWAALPPKPPAENPPEDPILPVGEVTPQPKSPNVRYVTPHCHSDIPGDCR